MYFWTCCPQLVEAVSSCPLCQPTHWQRRPYAGLMVYWQKWSRGDRPQHSHYPQHLQTPDPKFRQALYSVWRHRQSCIHLHRFVFSLMMSHVCLKYATFPSLWAFLSWGSRAFLMFCEAGHKSSFIKTWVPRSIVTFLITASRSPNLEKRATIGRPRCSSRRPTRWACSSCRFGR